MADTGCATSVADLSQTTEKVGQQFSVWRDVVPCFLTDFVTIFVRNHCLNDVLFCFVAGAFFADLAMAEASMEKEGGGKKSTAGDTATQREPKNPTQLFLVVLFVVVVLLEYHIEIALSFSHKPRCG